MQKFIAIATLIIAASAAANAKDPVFYQTGRLTQMQSISCGYTENSGKSFLGEVVGTDGGHEFDAIALPHPSGASTWFKLEPGRALLARAGAWGAAFSLSDRFGDHGLISVILCACPEPGTWEIDTWVMSCRVLGRGMERFAARR